ncbi:hypothetical protein FKM82_020280 [Ascaphus truei]
MFRLDDILNPFPHSPHTCGLSPVCVLMCVSRLDDTRNPFPHSPHNASFFTAVLSSIVVCPGWRPLNPFPHSPHTCGLSPVCVLLCMFMWNK